MDDGVDDVPPFRVGGCGSPISSKGPNASWLLLSTVEEGAMLVEKGSTSSSWFPLAPSRLAKGSIIDLIWTSSPLSIALLPFSAIALLLSKFPFTAGAIPGGSKSTNFALSSGEGMTPKLPFTPSSFPSCTRGDAATSPKGEAENGEDSCMAAVWGDKISSAGDVRGDSVLGESGS